MTVVLHPLHFGFFCISPALTLLANHLVIALRVDNLDNPLDTTFINHLLEYMSQ